MNESPFAAIQVGVVATRFGERITRAVHCGYDDPVPSWFQPSRKKSHNAMHRAGFSVYFEIEIDDAAREAAHPFHADVAGRSVFVEQLGLFA